MNPALDEVAKAGYEAFSARRRGYRKLPPWELALELDKEAWRAVARAVIDSQEEYVRNRTKETASLSTDTETPVVLRFGTDSR